MRERALIEVLQEEIVVEASKLCLNSQLVIKADIISKICRFYL
jgi:hypothetical protein